ncbi:DUF3592 domain-containing protein [Humitalea sp. 24SJ18S-53]|uniref:DUF3592 domain-containing protein n=1 Tax=Humitalea sp. 24SJ18S-53 TaxID=3422307 RepID=UPI003D66DF54
MRTALPKRRLYIIGILIALGIGAGAASLVRDYVHMLTHGVTTEGRMTGRYREVTSTGRGHAVSLHPWFSYRTADGSIITATVSDAMDLADIRAGRTMPLRYDPADPSVLRLAEALEAGPGALPWILGGLALIVGGLSVFGLVTGRSLRLPF